MHLMNKTNNLSLIFKTSWHLVLVVDWGLWQLQRDVHLQLHHHQHCQDWQNALHKVKLRGGNHFLGLPAITQA
jgi:hypothetical protein